MDCDFDASWCTVCDTLIAPKRYNVPLKPTLPQIPPSESPARSSSKKPKFKGTLIQGTGRVKATKRQLVPTPTCYCTIIDQGPQSLYCSDECKAADFESSLCPSVHPARAPTKFVPFSFSSSNEPRKYSPHVLAFAKQLNFPPLPDLNRIVYAEDDSDEEFVSQSNEYTGGIIMAARRIAGILPKPMRPRTSRYDPKPEVPKPIPGWTDGSNAWRPSVYYNTRLRSDPTINTTSSPEIRMRRHANAACVEERPADPTADLYKKFNECMSSRAESRMSPSFSSTSSNSDLTPTYHERSFLPSHLEGKLLVPDVKLKFRSPPSASLTSSSPSSTSTSSSRRSVRSPLSTFDQDLPNPLRVKVPQPEPLRSWSANDMLRYTPMKQPTRIVKMMQRVVGEDGKESWVEVQREELPQKLFLFPMARPMVPPGPGAILPASVRVPA